MANEPFSLKKLIDLSPLGFYKVIGLAIKAGIIILIFFGIVWVKNLLFPSEPSNVNKPEITVEPGGKLEYKVIQNEKGSGLTTDLFGGAHDSGDEWFAGVKVGKEW